MDIFVDQLHNIFITFQAMTEEKSLDFGVVGEIMLRTIPYLIAATFGGLIFRYIYGPKIKIKIERPNDLKDEYGTFYSINIANLGSTYAKKCISYLLLDDECIKNITFISPEMASSHEQLPRYLDDGDKKDGNKRVVLGRPRDQLTDMTKNRKLKQIFLCWTRHGNPFEQDVNPGSACSVDICRFQMINENFPGESYWLFPTERGWRVLQARVKAQRILLTGKLFICPANNFPYIADIAINLDKDNPSVKVTHRPLYRFFFVRNRIISK